MTQEFSSTLLENAVTELSRLPGVGRKTALRLALHLLRRRESEGVALGQAIIDLRRGVRYCRVCHNISETEVCPVCADELRDHTTICVVENVKDVMAFENTRQYNGLYHVLGGLISPVDGVGPDMLEIESLVARAAGGQVKEIIVALSPTMDGETTGYYLFRRLRDTGVAVSQLARGVSVGNEIEYTDEITLGRSLINRTPFGQG